MNSSSLPKIVFLDTVDSTNTFIAQRLQTDILPNGYCVAADYQRAGRQRMGECLRAESAIFGIATHTTLPARQTVCLVQSCICCHT